MNDEIHQIIHSLLIVTISKKSKTKNFSITRAIEHLDNKFSFTIADQTLHEKQISPHSKETLL